MAATLNQTFIQFIVLLLAAMPVTMLFVAPLRHQLYTDELTGLPNRNKLKKDLRSCSFPQLMLIDIDAFKDINNFYGVHVGDKLLVRVASCLKSLVPAGGAALPTVG